MMKWRYGVGSAIMALALLSGCGGDTGTSGNGQPLKRNSAPLRAAGQSASDYNAVVQQLYIAYFGRPADSSGLGNFSAQLAAAGAPSDIQGLVAAYAADPAVHALIDSFGNSAESKALYTGDTTSFVTAIYKNVLNRSPDAGGLAFWVNAIDNGGLSKGNASLSIMAGAMTNSTSQGLVDAQIVSNKVSVASQFTTSLVSTNKTSTYSGDAAAATARSMLSAVTEGTDANAFQGYISATMDTLSAVTNTSSPAVTFSPSKIVQSFTAGATTTFSVNATVNHLQDFAGASVIYTYIVDNVGIISPSVSIGANSSTSYTATFHSSTTIAAGRYQGNLALKLCKDSACTSQFPGSPVALPYDVTVVAPATAKLTATAAGTLTKSVHAGGASPSAVAISVSGSGLNWSASANASWLSLSGASGSGSGSFSVGFNTSGLTQGTYSATVSIASTDGQKVDLPVSLTVLPTSFQVDSTGVTFSAVNGAPIASQSIGFALDNSVPTAWAAASDSSWLTINPTSGTTPGTIALTANPATGVLASGSYTANVSLTSPNITTKSLAVKLNLTKPTFSASTSTVTFGGSYGRSFSSASTTLSLNTSTNSWPWSLSGVPSWLQPAQSSGTVNQSGTAISFSPSVQNAPVGTSTVTLTATAKVNGDTVTVPLSATIHKDQHRLLASEAGVGFASTPSWSNVSRTVTISDNYGKTTDWTAVSDQSWLTVTPSGTTGGNGASLTLTANPALLSSDTVSYATVTVSATSDTTVSSPEKIKVAIWKGSTTPSAMTKLSTTYKRVIADPIRPYAYLHNGASTIDVYNVYTASKVGTFNSAGNALGDMSISPDGDKLYVLDTGAKSVQVMDLITWNNLPVLTWTLSNAVTSSSTIKAVRPNGVNVILVGDGTAYLAASGKKIASTGIFGVMTATSDGKHVYTQDQGYSPASVASYSVDYSEMSGGVLMVSLQKSGSFINSSSNGREIAVSGDGTRLYTATGAPYKCTSVNPSTLASLGSLPGGDAYPNAVKVGSDGRVYCGISGWYSSADVWVHNTAGTLLNSYKFAGYAKALLDRQMVVSGDGFVLVALTDDPRLVFVPVGP